MIMEQSDDDQFNPLELKITSFENNVSDAKKFDHV